MRLAAHGLALDPPGAWDARIYRRRADEREVSAGTGGEASTRHAVLHAASFALPAERGDFGGGATELMATEDALVVLFEYHPDAAATELFRHRRPARLVTAMFSPSRLQRAIRGQAGSQHFFSEKGRAFCLYVVLGSNAHRALIVPRVNAVLARLEIESS